MQPTGKMGWALRYRFHGRPRKYTIGDYPAIGLKHARAAAARALASIANPLPQRWRQDQSSRKQQITIFTSLIARIKLLVAERNYVAISEGSCAAKNLHIAEITEIEYKLEGLFPGNFRDIKAAILFAGHRHHCSSGALSGKLAVKNN